MSKHKTTDTNATPIAEFVAQEVPEIKDISSINVFKCKTITLISGKWITLGLNDKKEMYLEFFSPKAREPLRKFSLSPEMTDAFKRLFVAIGD